jgi:hypothetical protein
VVTDSGVCAEDIRDADAGRGWLITKGVGEQNGDGTVGLETWGVNGGAGGAIGDNTVGALTEMEGVEMDANSGQRRGRREDKPIGEKEKVDGTKTIGVLAVVDGLDCTC